MITHCYQPVQSLYFQGIQAFFTPHHSTEAKKMQTYDTTQSANPAQHYPIQTSGIRFVILFSLALFLAYAVNNHLVTDAFAFTMSHLFDNFSIKSGSIYADIALLIFFSLAVFGLFCVFKFFLPLALTVLIIAGLAWVFLAPDTDQPHEVKIKSGDKFEKVYGG